jgi:hypothetical protein
LAGYTGRWCIRFHWSFRVLRSLRLLETSLGMSKQLIIRLAIDSCESNAILSMTKIMEIQGYKGKRVLAVERTILVSKTQPPLRLSTPLPLLPTISPTTSHNSTFHRTRGHQHIVSNHTNRIQCRHTKIFVGSFTASRSAQRPYPTSIFRARPS